MKAILREDEQAVSPVIATILMVAITVVLAAVLYVMVSGLIGTNPTSRPVVTLTLSSKVTGPPAGADILVSGIQPTAAPSNFKVNVENVTSSTFGTAVAAPATTGSGGAKTVTISGQTFTITWQNPGGSGQVSQGDHFVITSTSIKPGSSITYSFLLIWSDGSTLTSTNWQA